MKKIDSCRGSNVGVITFDPFRCYTLYYLFVIHRPISVVAWLLIAINLKHKCNAPNINGANFKAIVVFYALCSR